MTKLATTGNRIGSEQDAEFRRKFWRWPLATTIPATLAPTGGEVAPEFSCTTFFGIVSDT